MDKKFTDEYLAKEKGLISKLDLLTNIVDLFKRYRCSKCCKGGPILLSDEYLNHQNNVVWRDDDKVNLKFPCPYLKGNDCSIYDKRPRMCRSFPFVPSVYSDLVLIWDCKSGRNIYNAYNNFLDETNRDVNIDPRIFLKYENSPFFIFDIDMANITEFFYWLKEKKEKGEEYNRD